MKYNINDIVLIPYANSYNWKFEPTIAKIKDIYKKEYLNDLTYYCEIRDYRGNKYIEMFEKQIFALNEKEEIKEYINNYYYGGLCSGCKYKDASGAIWRCKGCAHAVEEKSDDITKHDKYVCELNHVVVGGTYSAGMEICKNFSPIREVDKSDFGSWEKYTDVLKNCDFNTECAHHKLSAHKTCTYEHYMSELVRIPAHFEYGNRTGSFISVSREEWTEQNFIVQDGKILCSVLHFDPIYNKNGSIKKGTANNSVNGNFILDIKNGKICEVSC